MKKIKVAILGCTGLVGREFVRLLDGHPWFTIACLSASARSAGRRYAETDPHGAGGSGAAGRLLVRDTSVEAVVASGARIAFSALPAAAAGPLEVGLRAAGVRVFSNAGAHRMAADVPLLVPEANAEHLELARQQLRAHPGFIVTNPNCVVSGLALALKPLMGLAPRAVSVTTFQAVSGGGRRGVAAWDILGNVVPFIAGEEDKVGREARKILGVLSAAGVRPAPVEVYPSCARVAVRDGHLQSVGVEFARPVDGDAAGAALAGFVAEPQRLRLPTAPSRPIVVRPEPDRPQPRLDLQAGADMAAGRGGGAGAAQPGRAAGMAVSVGRLRPQGKRLDFFLLVHNTVRGAAGGSLLNAELAARKGLIPGVPRG
jgi:aspartate-semialdehyde dehydrogenase